MPDQPRQRYWFNDRLTAALVFGIIVVMLWMGLTVYRNHERIAENTRTLATIESFRATEEAE